MTALNLPNLLKLALATLLMTVSAWAAALELKPYSAAELGALQQRGQSVAVHFHADWCSTCAAQAKSLETLKTDPQLQGMTVLVADYDQEKALRKSMKVRSQSIMVVFKGAQEVTRVNGQTRAQDLKAAFLQAL